MYKRITAWILLFIAVLALLPAPARAAEALTEAGASFCNSDLEAAHGGVCWYVDTMGDGRLMASRLSPELQLRAQGGEADFLIEPVTDFAVEQLAWWDGQLLVSREDRLLWLDPDSGRLTAERRFAAPIDRFALSPAGLYVLSGGELSLWKGEQKQLLRKGVSRFWLEDEDRLCYMQNEETVCTLRLSTGLVSEAPNAVSDLAKPAGEELCALSLTDAKQKFPHGKYWNHMPQRGTGMAYNKQDGWTNIPCTKHNNYCGTAYQTCNGYAPYGEEISYQCWGYADKLGHDISGRDPQNYNSGSGWTKLWTSAALNNLKAGDIIRYNKNGNSTYAHSIYVTAVNGDTIVYSDCNYDGTCVIRWDQTISKSTVKRWFVFLLSAPSAAVMEPQYLLDVNARLDGADAADAEGWATFDLWLNGKLCRSGLCEFRDYITRGTPWEIRNVKPVSGVMLDESAAGALSGTVQAECKPVLVLDHYYLNSAGEAVKTKLMDLPKPDKWSYRPVCWALEQGIAAGVSATSFAPEKNCTRAQAVTFLWVLSGRPEPQGRENPFTDVSPADYYYLPVLWAVERGVTVGKSPDSFGPKSECSRAEGLTFLWCLAGRPMPAVLAEAQEPGEGEESPAEPLPNYSPFRDVGPEHYYYTPVLWAVEQGVTAGTGSELFSPKQSCTRAQIVAFLYAYSRLN